MKAFPLHFTARDEIYQMKDYSRDRVRVLALLDTSKMDLKNPRVHRTDCDFALAWARNYGKGRVFYSAFGHTDESWDDPRMRSMWIRSDQVDIEAHRRRCNSPSAAFFTLTACSGFPS